MCTKCHYSQYSGVCDALCNNTAGIMHYHVGTRQCTVTVGQCTLSGLAPGVATGVGIAMLVNSSGDYMKVCELIVYTSVWIVIVMACDKI